MYNYSDTIIIQVFAYVNKTKNFHQLQLVVEQKKKKNDNNNPVKTYRYTEYNCCALDYKDAIAADGVLLLHCRTVMS